MMLGCGEDRDANTTQYGREGPYKGLFESAIIVSHRDAWQTLRVDIISRCSKCQTLSIIHIITVHYFSHIKFVKGAWSDFSEWRFLFK